MELLVPALLFIFAFYGARHVPHAKYWVGALILILLVGLSLASLTIYESMQTNCGAKYDVDTGCANVLPGWTMLVGLGLGLLSMVVSLIIIGIPLYYRRKQHSLSQ